MHWWCLLASLAQPAELTTESKLPKCDFSQIEVRDECPSEVGFDWEVYGEELYRARSMVFAGDIVMAERSLQQLLQVITGHFSLAFECPLAAASTYFSLAQVMAFHKRMRRSLALLHMGFIFVRDKGFNECTPWPVQGWDMLLAARNNLQHVQTIDDQSVVAVPKPYRAMRVAVCTICAYAEDEIVRVVSQENHELYTKLHGYDLYFYTDASQILPNVGARMNVNDGVHKPFFWKVNAVKNILDKYDWVLWADCDALFMDPQRTLDSIIHMYTSNLTAATTGQVPGGVHPVPVNLLIAVDSTGINNGVWLLRNSPWSHTFLEDWWHSNILQGAGKNHNCSDQSTMQHALLYTRSLALDADWDAVEAPIWPPEVRVVRQEYLQSFHSATAITVLSREWTAGDFIKHHPGCHYYKEPCKALYVEAHNIFLQELQKLVNSHAEYQKNLAG
jgi:hypothetical protein